MSLHRKARQEDILQPIHKIFAPERPEAQFECVSQPQGILCKERGRESDGDIYIDHHQRHSNYLSKALVQKKRFFVGRS